MFKKKTVLSLEIGGFRQSGGENDVESFEKKGGGREEICFVCIVCGLDDLLPSSTIKPPLPPTILAWPFFFLREKKSIVFFFFGGREDLKLNCKWCHQRTHDPRS